MTIYNHSTSTERDGHQNDNAGLERCDCRSTKTTGQGASVASPTNPTYTYALIGFLGFCIQQKGSPYETVHGTRLMNLLIISISAHVFCINMIPTAGGGDDADLEDLMKYVFLLLGYLPPIIELIILTEKFGLFILSVWSICLLLFVCKYHQSLLTLCNNAVKHGIKALLGEFGQTLGDWNSGRRIRNDEAEKMRIRNLKREIELQPLNQNISNERRATEHQSQNQNHTNVTEYAISILDNS
uniref:uncharacterized protein LOC101304493 n=1 Tax=Fragaria vesca subsp. vesca TaxID=101020 RepID=UPI0005C9189B|nr:PREDICTED: uncharacterized protein LOC101304493 [Fragaria vesca subsp. vesca]